KITLPCWQHTCPNSMNLSSIRYIAIHIIFSKEESVMGIFGRLFKRRKLELRLLHAGLELLKQRVEHLESLLAAATFPDSETVERLSKFAGESLAIQTMSLTIPGTLVA